MSQAELFGQRDVDLPQLGSVWNLRGEVLVPDPWRSVIVCDLDSFGMVGFRAASSRPDDFNRVRWVRREKFFKQYEEGRR